MKHLTKQDLVDLADGNRSDSTVPHLKSCVQCRQQLAELRAIVSEVGAIEVPEPSPLFWDRLSARVREAIASERPAVHTAWTELLTSARLSLAAAVGLVAIGLVVSMAMRTTYSTVAVPTARSDRSIPVEAADVVTLAPDDPTLDLVADLSSGLDWDDVHDAAIVTHTGLVDRAVGNLSAGERAELGRLLQRELEKGGS